MATINQFEDLELWQHSRRLASRIFHLTNTLPFSKDYRFKDQIRSAAGSVMDNIAEGFERSSRLEFIQFLGISKGSCGEVRSQLYRAHDQEYISVQDSEELIFEYKLLGSKLAGFIAYLNSSKVKVQKFKERQ